jgi:hypothetical protein
MGTFARTLVPVAGFCSALLASSAMALPTGDGSLGNPYHGIQNPGFDLAVSSGASPWIRVSSATGCPGEGVALIGPPLMRVVAW